MLIREILTINLVEENTRYDTVSSSELGNLNPKIPKGNYKPIPSPDPTRPGETWLQLTPDQPNNTKFKIKPYKTGLWAPAHPSWGPGVIVSPQIGDDRMGYIANKIIDDDGKYIDKTKLNDYLKTLSWPEYHEFRNLADGGSGGRWEYKVDPNYKEPSPKTTPNSPASGAAIQPVPGDGPTGIELAKFGVSVTDRRNQTFVDKVLGAGKYKAGSAASNLALLAHFKKQSKI